MSTEMADLVLEDAEEKMHKAVVHARAEFATVFASYIRPSGSRRMARLIGGNGKAAG